ncbi:MAG: HEPN domain-containing protein [bacterium]
MPGIKDWEQKASADLKLATKSICDDETIDPAIYLTHQCAEKSLKTFFVFLGKAIPKTHDLSMLLDGCTKLDVEFALLQKACQYLDPYGFNSRYPNDSFHVNQKDLIEAIDLANKISNFVKNKVIK